MSTNGAIESLEIERKYQIPADAELPSEEAFAPIGLRFGEAQHLTIDAEYFDTPDLALGALRIALRRRRGGKDDGWHIKEKGDDSAREFWWPSADTLPEGLRAALAERIGAAAVDELVSIARIVTDRRTQVLIDSTGRAVIELADDRVNARNALTETGSTWREWESELLADADPVVLDTVEAVLLTVGAERVRGLSKIQRTMLLGMHGS